MEVRLRVLEMQKESERKWAAVKVQNWKRFKSAMAATDDELMVMTMEGKLSKQQLAKVAAEKMKRQGKSRRREGVVGEGADALTGDGDDSMDGSAVRARLPAARAAALAASADVLG